MRRMYSKNQLIKLIDEHTQESMVQSVNGKSGEVVLNGTDIKLTTNQQSVQDNIIRIDEILDEELNYYMHVIHVFVNEEDDDFFINGTYTLITDSDQSINTWPALITALTDNIDRLQFTGEITATGSPVLALSPIMHVVAQDQLRAYCDIAYDKSLAQIDENGFLVIMDPSATLTDSSSVVDTVYRV